MLELKKNANGKSVKGPLLLVIMDGVGIYKGMRDGYFGNAFDIAYTPNLDALFANTPLYTKLKAHGTAVGLPSDADMGNSEVGHNAIGAGRIIEQGAKLVNSAIETRGLFNGKTWMEDIGNAQNPGHALSAWLAAKAKNPRLQSKDAPVAVHFIGLLSDGNVHSHIDHLIAMLRECAAAGVHKAFVHALLDGRDVEEVSAERYVAQLEDVLAQIRAEKGFYYHIASGGGRMVVTMDRYEANWNQVKIGWQTHVAGEGAKFPDAMTAINSLRETHKSVIDQDLPPFVVASPEDATKPIGPIADGDVVIFYNFRGDRAIEISRAFTEAEFDKFERRPFPKVHYSGMMEYDGDLRIPPRYLVEPPHIKNTISEYLADAGVKSFAISETQKYGHVTYFWNGNNSQPFDAALETWVNIPSDVIPFEKAPAMKCYEITDRLLPELESGKYAFLRANFPNGDMVGHTGVLGAAIEAMNALDRNMGRIIEAARKIGATLVVTADHGNCDQMFEIDKSGKAKICGDGKPMSKTSHTLCPVPFAIMTPSAEELKLADVAAPGLANIAATLLTLMGYDKPDGFEPSIVEWKE